MFGWNYYKDNIEHRMGRYKGISTISEIRSVQGMNMLWDYAEIIIKLYTLLTIENFV